MSSKALIPARGALAAVGFLTLVPVPTVAAEDLPLGRFWFPLVGAGIGAAADGVDWALTPLLGRGLGAVAAIATLAVLTGGLHLDGLADSADGFFGGHSREQRLAIMRDSRLGAFGAIAIVVVLLGEFSALADLSPGSEVLTLSVAGAISRWAVVLVLLALPYARDQGLGVAWRSRWCLLVAVVGTAELVPLVWLGGVGGLRGLGLAGLAAILISLLAMRRIGGATGDVYGAVAEACQLMVLVGFVMRG